MKESLTKNEVAEILKEIRPKKGDETVWLFTVDQFCKALQLAGKDLEDFLDLIEL